MHSIPPKASAPTPVHVASGSEPIPESGQSSDVGVLLVNLGSPSAPTTREIRRFLGEFLADPRVVELPRIVWLPLLKSVVLPFRPRRIRDKYAAIWMPEGSPLIVWSQRQADAVQRELVARGHSVSVSLGMRYGEPSLAGALDDLRTRGCRRILVLPLYPQYSATTTATVIDRVGVLARTMRDQPEFRYIQRFYDDKGYIAAVAHRVRDFWSQHGRGDKLLMSFHGLPRRAVELGDPYEDECRRSAKLIAEALHLSPEQYTVTFQSRFGRAKWLEPDTETTVRQLAEAGSKTLDVICPGFVADCLETLEEVAIGCKDTFERAGGKSLRYIPTLNAEPAWIGALTSLVERNLLGWDTAPVIRRSAVATIQTPSGNEPEKHAIQSKDPAHQEEQLDDAIEDTFPASDPVPPDVGKQRTAAHNPAKEDRVEQELDDAIEDTFPASDPYSITAVVKSAKREQE